MTPTTFGAFFAPKNPASSCRENINQSLYTMKNIHTENFLDFVGKQQGKVLTTLARRAKFQVKVVPSKKGRGLLFKVLSTGNERKHTHQYVELVNEMFNQLKSFKTADYNNKTADSSYHLA
jgi:hypothetical protein